MNGQETEAKFYIKDLKKIETRLQNSKAHLTYKGASLLDEGILSRREIEFGVESFELARQFLEELGYQKLAYYEKYRTTYEVADAHVLLDEKPYADLVEIEGENHQA